MGQGGFGAHSEAKFGAQFMQTKFLCHKMSQNSTVLTVSSSSDCTLDVNQCRKKETLILEQWQNRALRIIGASTCSE